MFDYLQQFNKLPKELRERVSSPAAMEILSSLEKKYSLSLAMLVMQIMIKQVLMKDLVTHLMSEMGLSQDKAQALNQELRERLFFSVSTYLGLKSTPSASSEEKELQALMKENNIVLPSSDLMSRCQQILLTYRKGVRTKMDTRSALERPVVQGGLSLDAAAADRLLRALDQAAKPVVPVESESNSSPTSTSSLPKASTALTDLVNKNEAAAYDFKSALAKGAIKAPASLANKFKTTPVKLDLSHEIEAPEKELALEAPEPELSLSAPDKSAPVKLESLTPASSKQKEEASQSLDVVSKQDKLKVSQENLSPEKELEKTEKTADNVSSQPTLADLKVKESEEKIVTPIKQEDLSEISPEQPSVVTSNNSFKKPVSAKGGLWSKLFKEKAPAVNHNLGKTISSSHHLEEAVKIATQKTSSSARPAASSDNKTRMEDVKARPRVMGPLEELRYLDLKTFRQLGSSPKEITGKIVMKIKLLEKDGYDRMFEGVKAWRQSPVNRIYVRLAQEAVGQGMTLRDSVAARQAANKETLTMDEIEAIVNMNTQLMF